MENEPNKKVMIFRFLTIAWNSTVWPGGLVNELDSDYLRQNYVPCNTPEEYTQYCRRQLFPGYGVYYIA